MPCLAFLACFPIYARPFALISFLSLSFSFPWCSRAVVSSIVSALLALYFCPLLDLQPGRSVLCASNRRLPTRSSWLQRAKAAGKLKRCRASSFLSVPFSLLIPLFLFVLCVPR
jgi:hypothetical protein